MFVFFNASVLVEKKRIVVKLSNGTKLIIRPAKETELIVEFMDNS